MAYPFPFVAGNILTAAELNALETATATPGLGFTSGSYYSLTIGAGSDGTQTESLCRYSPFFVSAQRAFDRIGIVTGAGGAGTNNIRLGIYNNDTATGKPSTVKLDAGTVAANAASTLFTITISQTLASGWYWLAFCAQGGGGTRVFPNSAFNWGSTPTQLTTNYRNPTSGFTQAGVAGAFATAVPVRTDALIPMPFLRAT